MRTSTPTSPISAAAAPISRCGRPSMLRPMREEAAMNFMPKINRRGFVVGAVAAGGGLALAFDLPFGGPDVVRAADGSPEVNAWMVIRRDDTVVIRIARSEMGQGTMTGLAPRGRGARLRLVESDDRIPDPGTEHRAQSRLGRLFHRRQPRHPHVPRLPAQGRRNGARDVDLGGGAAMERAGVRV